GDVPGVPVLGKSGTTSSYRDAWFCGFTGNYVAAVWFGNDDYHATRTLTGGTLPAIAFQKFMAYAHTNIDIQPVFGVDFAIAPKLVADADPDLEEDIIQRPPSLTQGAARKLVDLANRLAATRGMASPPIDQASIAGPAQT